MIIQNMPNFQGYVPFQIMPQTKIGILELALYSHYNNLYCKKKPRELDFLKV